MSIFKSIPVNSGDCFYLEVNKDKNKKISALIDGGAGSIKLSGKNIGIDSFLVNRGILKLDVIVATHNDKDHVGGLKKILSNSSINTSFLYLPAIWFDRLDDVLDKPRIFFSELLDDLSQLSENEDLSENDSDVPVEELGSISNDTLKSLDAIHIFRCKICRSRLLKNKNLSNKQKRKLDEALDALSNILELYQLAIQNNVKICWFEFDDKNLQQNENSLSKNIPNILIPVNSKYITIRQKNKYKAYQWLYLTMVNKRSLVFYHSTLNGGEILFSSDSLLNFALPKFNNLLATVPHHGRKSNSSAIHLLTRQYPNLIFVRNSHSKSDGKNMSSDFINFGGKKYCDICFNQSGLNLSSSQDVEFIFNGGAWNLSSKSSACICT